MTDYRPPLTDVRFVLDEIVGLSDVLGFDAYSSLDSATVHEAIGEAGRFFAEVVAPLNRVGDQQGVKRRDDGSVQVPDGWTEAYQQLVASGWNAAPFDPAYGGGGLPEVVGIVLQEFINSASMAFALCPMLTLGAIHALIEHGTEEMRETYLAKLLTGEWAGTMNLTEPQAGSDVGALRARAERQSDGTYRLFGTKIFITYGEHDMTDNIIHFVLARTPGAPPGTKGISCFIVPKFLVNDDGSLGARNDVSCASLEHKMGIHASPTCVMNYGDHEGAVAYLIGEENAGMRYMFTMMNSARLGVGLEGLGIAERAYQLAAGYALERKQGRAAGAPAGESSSIVEHPDVRRMLMTMRAQIEAVRALCYLNAISLDRAAHHPDPSERERSDELASLLTPLSKAWGTDVGTDVASLGIQVFGGMGFIEETGAAQHYRDARIAQIYEGTNGIQALDLVGRKLPMRGGGVVADLLKSMRATVGAIGDDLVDIRQNLASAIDACEETSTWLLGRSASGDVNDVLGAATPYLRLCGLTVGGWLLARGAVAASALKGSGRYDDAFLDAKIITARFFAQNLLPHVHGLVGPITAGASSLMSLPSEGFVKFG
ncbi:MAG: acyl-CoA dehydrogenase C-terminal domain-containing protein [Acidimicrobiia bacterium]